MKIIKAYTLVEILIALSIFAIIGLLTTFSIIRAFDTKAHLDTTMDNWNQFQLAYALLEQDTTQIVDRPIVKQNYKLVASFKGQINQFEFTRQGMVNPNAAYKFSNLLRVRYFCHNNKLIRRTWSRIDSVLNQYNDSVLLYSLKACEFYYLSHDNQMLHQWNKSQMPSAKNHTNHLPKAIQVKIRHAQLGQGSFWFPIPIGAYES